MVIFLRYRQRFRFADGDLALVGGVVDRVEGRKQTSENSWRPVHYRKRVIPVLHTD